MNGEGRPFVAVVWTAPMIDDSLPVPHATARISLIAKLADIPEDIWLAKQKSPRKGAPTSAT